MNIGVLGATGMLGSETLRYLRLNTKDYRVNAVSAHFLPNHHNEELIDELSSFDLVINCAGAIPQRRKNRDDYFEINWQLPQMLVDQRIYFIHPCTDCVFSGSTGSYSQAPRWMPAMTTA